MANRPANAGSGRGLASAGNAAPPLDAVAPPPFDAAPPPFDAAPPPFDAAPPPPVHHDAPPATRPRVDAPRTDAPAAPRANAPAAPRAEAGHRAARSREPRPARDRNSARDRGDAVASGLAWLPYLIVLAGAALGMFVAWQGSRYAGRGAALVGCSLLAAGLARLILPPRYAGLLSTRRKASDVLTFALFGAAVLAVALMLP